MTLFIEGKKPDVERPTPYLAPSHFIAKQYMPRFGFMLALTGGVWRKPRRVLGVLVPVGLRFSHYPGGVHPDRHRCSGRENSDRGEGRRRHDSAVPNVRPQHGEKSKPGRFILLPFPCRCWQNKYTKNACQPGCGSSYLQRLFASLFWSCNFPFSTTHLMLVVHIGIPLPPRPPPHPRFPEFSRTVRYSLATRTCGASSSSRTLRRRTRSCSTTGSWGSSRPSPWPSWPSFRGL